jgi:predicted glycogen debranching enzyme
MIRIDLEPTGSLDLDREWLDTDGRGGYASTTLAGCHTRRHHGLMVANLPSPEGRYVLLSKLEDSLLVGEEEHFFSHHRYPGVFFPPGPSLLREFILDIRPRFTYQAGRICMQKTVMLVRGTETLLLRYDLDGSSKDCILRLKPFLAFRGYHALAHENPYLRSRTERSANGFKIEPYEGMPPLVIRTSAASKFLPSPLWYKRFEYSEDRERGFDFQEDLFLPGIIEVPIKGKGPVILSVSCAPSGKDPGAIWKTETARRRRERKSDEILTDGFDGEDKELLLALIHAARQFLITTPSGRPAIVAGYPWFESWGRDTLISLPGLTFCCGRIREGIEILTELGRHEREGLFPNFLSTDGKPEAYNTVDSSLLYFRTVQELFRITGDRELIRDRFWPVMKKIIHDFMSGTRFGIMMDDRGLLHAGDGQTALTWMDATVAGAPVTPRHGCAVEINALWYNALCFASTLSEKFDDPEWSLERLTALIRGSFRETFWVSEGGYLGDVFREGVLDNAVRPNQLFAVCLPFSPLDPAEQAGVVRTVREQLLTPCGLRTLSPADPAYRGRYRGNSAERDAAYHQGTVWPWLLGSFGEAALRVAADLPHEKEELRKFIRDFLRIHLHEAGIGSVSEIFDGDAPHRPGGCIAQAWSVAELIRLYMLLRE